MQSLLIIDMQNAWIDEHPRFDIAAITQRINQLSGRFRELALPVIFVSHQDASVLVDSCAWQIHADFVQADTDHSLHKTACDSFADTNLKELLEKLGSTHISICGLATEFCVNSSLYASLSHGFDVTLIADAHTTADRPHLTAKAIIEHHNWVWTNMALPRSRQLKVINCQDYLEELMKVR